MIELGVNIDHVATLRQQRHTVYPDLVAAALRAEDAGADLITLHLREDRRHIQDKDVYALRPPLRTRMNLECAITAEMLEIARAVKPSDVCLVPEKRTELTTEGGLEVAGALAAVTDAVGLLAESGIRVSLFIDPEPAQIAAAAQAGAPWSSCTPAPMPKRRTRPRAELTRIRVAVAEGLRHGLRVNAGHGLHYGNVGPVAAVDGIAELNIGHAIVAQAVFDGWEKAVRDMKALMVQARAARPLIRGREACTTPRT